MASDREYAEIFQLFYGYRPGPDGTKRVQSMAGLEPTGELDEATLALMHAPRCGVSDHLDMVEYARWRKNRLNFYIESRPRGIAESDYDTAVTKAFGAWSAVANLHFTRVFARQEADLIISTGRGPRAGFDGPGGTLAWAELPPGNDQPLMMRLDLDENWKWVFQNLETVAAVLGVGSAILVFNVLVHEIGHLLGLDHSRNRNAVMFAMYSAQIATPQADDVRRIQLLYGPPVDRPPQPGDPPHVPPTNGGFMDSLKSIRDIVKRLYDLSKLIPGNQPDAALGALLQILDMIVAFGGSLGSMTEAEVVAAVKEKLAA